MGLVKCSKCGTEINERDIKCKNCGAINFGFNPIEPKEENSNIFEEVTVNLETEVNTSSITSKEKDGNIEEIPDNKEENINKKFETEEDLIQNKQEDTNNEPIVPFVQEQELDNNTKENSFNEFLNNISFDEKINDIKETEINAIPNFFEEVSINSETEVNTSSMTSKEKDGNIEEIPDNKEEVINEESKIKTDLIPNNQEDTNNEPIVPFVQEQELNNNTEVKEETKTPQLENDNKNIIQNTNNKKEATIKCSNCGDLVSKKAKKCPNCGNKLKSNNLLIIAIIIFFILLLVIIMFIIGSDDSLDVNKKHDNNIESGGTTILENKDETEETPQTNENEPQTEFIPEIEENIESEVPIEPAPPTNVAPPTPPAPVCNESAKQQLTNEYQTTIQQRDAEYNANYLDAQQKVEKANQLLELAGGYLSQSDFNEQYSQATSDVQKQLLESRYNMSKNYDGMVNSFNQLPTTYNNWKDTYTKWYQQELQNLGC